MAKQYQEIDISPFENCIQDPQAILSRALENQNIRDFKIALEMDADPTRIDEEKNISIFEKALQTHGCAEFVEECIRRGCKCDYINHRLNKAPINFATDSRDPKIVSAVLGSCQNILVDTKYQNLTPLLSLTKSLTSDNYNNVFECIKLLIEYGANPNIPDKREMLPLLYIVNNRNINLEQKHQLIEYILQNSKYQIDLDTFRDGETRERIQSELPDIILPSSLTNNDNADHDNRQQYTDSGTIFEILLSHLRNGNENKFIQMYNEFIKTNTTNHNDTNDNNGGDGMRNDDEENHILLLHESIKKYLNNAANLILKNPSKKININYLIKDCSIIEIACVYGNWKILQQLLNMDNLKLRKYENLLIKIITKLDEKINITSKSASTSFIMMETNNKEYPDYYKCFNILLNSNKIDINEIDKSGTSALHYAIKYKNEYAINKLLKYGAYIGMKSSKFNDFAINDINSNLLESHFNSCIKTNNLKLGDDNFEIIIDYKNLIPPSSSSSLSANKKMNNNNNHISNNNNNGGSDQKINQEMLPIEFIANSKEYRYLLNHPLITSFLYLKWYRLSIIFYINFILYSLFYVSLITYIMLNFNASNQQQQQQQQQVPNDNKTLATIFIFKFLSYIGLFYMIIRELIQIFISPIIYFRSTINYLEIIIIILTGWILYDTHIDYDIEKKRILAVIIILLISIELCMLIGSLPILSISTHMLMLQTVSKSFIKSFALYSVFIITFSLCFYILFGAIMQNNDDSKNIMGIDKSNNGSNNNWIGGNNNDGDGNGIDDGNNDNDEFNKFSNPFTAIIKTIVMLTGEFDAGDLDFHSFTSYMVFLLFVFFMSIVLFNLLNGLAVSDTQAIKSQAELNGSICRTNLLSSYENVLTGNDNKTIFLINYHPFRKICKRLTNLFPNFINGKQISILPNDGNKILIPMINNNSPTNIKITSDNDKEYPDKITEIALIENNLTNNRKYIHYGGVIDQNDYDYGDINNDNDNNENDEYEMEMKMKILNSPINMLLPSCCCFLTSFLNGQCSKMDIRTVKNSLQIIEKNHLEKLEKHKLHTNELRLKNIENKIDKIFNLLQEIHLK